jgi:hypothetical protein
MRKFGVSEAVAILISFLEAEGSRLPPERGLFAEASDELDRRDLLFAPVIVETEYRSDDRELEPVLDGLWQAYGCEYCFPTRDSEGRWQGLASFSR